MPVEHSINETNSVVLTQWEGEATDDAFLEAYQSYLETVKSSYPAFNEIVDIRNATPIKLTITGLIDLGRIAARADEGGRRQKMALVIRPGNAFILARAYIFYRNMCRSDCKQIETLSEH